MTINNINNDKNVRKWYAFYTKPRHEFTAARDFRAEDYEFYLPTIEVIKQWSDRKKKVVEPLFRGYIFLRANLSERLFAVQKKSIVKVISFEGKPSVVPDWEIENLKRLLEEADEIEVGDIPDLGSTVKVIAGPFSGIEGVVYQNNNNDRLLAVSVELLNRSVIVRLPVSSVVEKGK
jgi:transcription antitermination factor NusG